MKTILKDGVGTWLRGLASVVTMLAIGGGSFLPANAATVAMDVNQEQVRAWNRFADTLIEMHQRAIANHEVRTTETSGRHGGEFASRYTYSEVSYFDAKTGRLLSRIRREGDKPQNIQMIDVFVYDSAGRVVRDYTALYLPWGRNAPIRTFINLHHYENGLHGYRQFDASGNRLYEQCRGTLKGKQVNLSLEDYQVNDRVMNTAAYQACFTKLPETAERYLDPH